VGRPRPRNADARRRCAERLWQRSIGIAEAGGATFSLAEAFEAGTRTGDHPRAARARGKLLRNLDTDVQEQGHSAPDRLHLE